MNEEYQNFENNQENPESQQYTNNPEPQYTPNPEPQYGAEQNTAYSGVWQAPSYQAPQQPAPRKPKKKHWGVRVAVVALCCALVGSVAGGAIVGSVTYNMYKNDAADNTQTTISQPPTPTEAPTSQVVHTRSDSSQYTPAEIYEKYVDAVVSIASSGTGFVISSDGEILTNYHVVKNATKLTVTMNSGESYNATVIGYEEDSDVALIKIDAQNLTTVQLGKSSELRVGDEVAAIGNPLGELTNTMTVGYVSALDRYINTDGSPINMMQIDAAINSGNSGGPLFDMYGNVVGITTAKYSGTTNSGTTIEGIGFAIPIDDVTSILDDLRTNGRVTNRAYIGITARSVSQTDAEKFGFPLGALVDSVEDGGAGAQAGLKRYDIITAIDSKSITSLDDLSAALKSYRAGDQATLTVYRSGQSVSVTLTFGEKPATTQTDTTQQEQQGQQPSESDDSQSGWSFPWNMLP